MPDVEEGQTESRPPVGGGSGTTNTAAVFGAGFLLGLGAGFLLATSVCNKSGPEMTAATGTTTGVVVQASPDSGSAPPR